jgi:hypothetical protein
LNKHPQKKLRETSDGSGALSSVDLIIAFLVVFVLGFGAGYAIRERKSRMRRRRYYHGDTAD